ncbi:cytochrome P450 [Streptomyces rubradiris]|uniref:cytochrome P450 n=1 Tax=Streptomyces rubradiris TaxID=285531 RepID=UPI0036E784F5
MDATGAGEVPLAPGGVPLLGHLPGLARRRTAFLQTLRECGDVVEMRLGRRPFYVLNAPEAIHDVLVAQSGKFSKGMLFDQVRPYIGNGLASSDGPFHLRQRRAMQPAFHRERVARYSRTFTEVAGDRVAEWPEGKVMAMGREMRELAVAMLVPALFPFAEGSRTRRVVEDLGARVSRDLDLLVRGVLRATILPPPLAVVPTPGRRRFLASAAALRRLAEQAVRQARHSPEGDGVLALMLAHEGGMSDEEACDEVLTLLVAGVETTATTLSWALYALARNPSMADRMHDEARAAEPGVVTPAALPYTARFVHEVLRPDPLWHAIAKAVALMAVLDDVVVPPRDVADGTHRIGDESLADVLDRVKALGGDRDARWLAHAYEETLFSARIQFHEKWSTAEPGMAPPARLDAVQAYVGEPDMLRASIVRTYAAETLPVMHLIAYYFRFSFDDCDWAAFVSAGVAQTLGMDISKDQYGVGVKEATNFGVRPGRQVQENVRRRTELHRTFLCLTARFQDITDFPTTVYDRYSRVSLSYARLVDRYIERRDMTRIPMNATLSAVVDDILTGR